MQDDWIHQPLERWMTHRVPYARSAALTNEIREGIGFDSGATILKMRRMNPHPIRPLLIAITLSLTLAAGASVAFAADDYQLGPDSLPRDGVPKGTLTKHLWEESANFPDTIREYYV
jgi:hypothetical protein